MTKTIVLAEKSSVARDVVFNKVTTIERCVMRVQEVYAGNPENLRDYTKQDSIILNIQRACESNFLNIV